ncbi:MAG: hypothetical protein IKD73_01305 [Selenomonadaceae bacterium]|nr:hypothetical protein [Selenomonadaceae bacterium]
MEKFFKSLVLGAGLILGSQFMAIPTAAAQDVYIETEYGGSRDIYVVTESIDTNGIDYARVTVKYIKDGRLTYTEHRNYGRVNGQWWVNSEEGKRDRIRATRVWNVAEDKVLIYCLNYRQ